MSLFYNSIL